MRRRVRFFVSYAHSNAKNAGALLQRLQEQLEPSRNHEYVLWRDAGLLVGEDWEDEIHCALDEAEFGLLLVSPAFLASEYIAKTELPALLKRPVMPVLLEQIDRTRHDLRGLHEKQTYALTVGQRRCAFADCATTRDKRGFVDGLFEQMEARLDKLLAAQRGTA
jgi:hypothetical protein